MADAARQRPGKGGVLFQPMTKYVAADKLDTRWQYRTMLGIDLQRDDLGKGRRRHDPQGVVSPARPREREVGRGRTFAYVTGRREDRSASRRRTGRSLGVRQHRRSRYAAGTSPNSDTVLGARDAAQDQRDAAKPWRALPADHDDGAHADRRRPRAHRRGREAEGEEGERSSGT